MTGYGLLIVAAALGSEPSGSPTIDRQSAVERPPELVVSVVESVDRGLAVVQRGADNYPKNRDCFSCHHQALPIFATRAAAFGRQGIVGGFVDRQLQFTRESFAARLESLRSGKRIGGRAATASYALWMFQIADSEPDELTDALVEYLLKSQEEDGRWQPPSQRPPLEESAHMCTTLAVIGLQAYAGDDARDRATEAVARAVEWAQSAAIETHEDFVAHLWLLSAMDSEKVHVSTAQEAVLSRQHENGGWAQTDDLAPGAYATGQAVYVLLESGLPADHPAMASAVQFLLENQQEDGSWHVVSRSDPVQKWFDNGDPHGDDQFISIAATSWAAAGLAAWLGPLAR